MINLKVCNSQQKGEHRDERIHDAAEGCFRRVLAGSSDRLSG